MSEEQQQTQQEQESTGANWREVGEQFERLGQSLADALRATFSEAEQSGQWERVRTGMESVAREVGQAVEDTAKSPKAQELKVEAQKTVDQLRTAGSGAAPLPGGVHHDLIQPGAIVGRRRPEC